jgi:DNA-binding response OmpR family regulator
MKILLVEDEIKLARFIKIGLEQSGHVTDMVHDGSKGLEMAAVNQYDLIILDLMLPGQNGFEVLKNLQSFKINIPVIILSALTDTEKVISGLDAGALDYMKKPFELEELLARIRTVQRKQNGAGMSVLKVGDLTVDLRSREVQRAGMKIFLSNREFALLELLLSQANRLVSKNKIAEKVWEADFDMGSNVIEVHIHQLRKKIDKGFEEPLIHTMIGAGYMIKGLVKK